MSKVISLFFYFCALVSNGLKSGQWLSLNRCGQHREYQEWLITSTNSIKLASFSNNSCIQCSNVNYCGNSYYPVIITDTDTTFYNANCDTHINQKVVWNVTHLSNDTNNWYRISTSDGSNLCIQSMGNTEYAAIQMIECNIGYNNDIFQEWLLRKTNHSLSSSDSYEIVSSSNVSLCLTAAYYQQRNCSQSPFNKYKYCNISLPTSIRVNDLISRMTLYEKISNLGILQNIGVPRLGFPQISTTDCLHGVAAPGCGKIYKNNTGCATSFPHALLLSASFNRTLWHKIGQVIGTEARGLYNQGTPSIAGLILTSPNVNLFRDPRWGRGQETPGEDPYLTGQYGMNMVNGLQYGSDKRYLKTSVTVKHFGDYDLEGGRYGVPHRTFFNGNVSDRDQIEYYWPSWRTVVQNAKVSGIMCSYPSINSIPQCGDNYFMNDVLRNQWGFDGYIMSDQGAIVDGSFTQYIKQINNGSDDKLLHCKIAMKSGCDLAMGQTYNAYIYDAIKLNYLNESDINLALSRLFTVVIELGLIDYPGPYYNTYNEKDVDTLTHRELALNAAQQGIVLLKNDNSILPLPINNNKLKYAFLGPHANSTTFMLSNYFGKNTLVSTHSPYQVAKNKYNFLNVSYSLGCIDGIECLSTDGFNESIEMAKTVDFCIVFLGLKPLAWGGGINNTAVEAEAYDRKNVTFPGNQLSFLKQIFNVNENIILVLFNGSPIDITWAKNNIYGIIESFYPGELGGDALLSILFGDISPSARLPYTIYNSTITDRPITDMSLRGNGGITYRYYNGKPVYPFGYGLSYTKFIYKYFNDTTNIKNINEIFNKNTAPFYTIQVTNIGNMDSDDVVLGFITSNNPDSPNIKLFDFQKAFVRRGQSVNVTLSVAPETISLTNIEGVERIIPDKYTLYLGDYMNNNYIQTELQLIGLNETKLFKKKKI